MLFCLASPVASAVDEGLVDVAQVLDPALSGGELVAAMDRLMGRTDCATTQGPGLERDCQIIPQELAQLTEASRGLVPISGSTSYRACGALTVRPGVNISEMIHAQTQRLSTDQRVITLQDRQRGEVRVSVNRFGVGVRLSTDDFSEGSSLKVGVGKQGGAGATFQLKIR